MKEKQDNSSEPKLCVSCNRFYGNPATDCMCSKCYAAQNKQATAAAKQSVPVLNSQSEEEKRPAVDLMAEPKKLAVYQALRASIGRDR